MKVALIFVICLSLNACFLMTRTVKQGELFTIKGSETVKVEGTDLQIKIITTKTSDYFNKPIGVLESCEFEVKSNNKTEKRELGNHNSTIVDGFNIKLERLDTGKVMCGFIVSKAE
ncbi:MAG TPA: hypothetical protein PKY82_16695 [Pyrinomonadaceae bacterium]|nr:hypothetical protein [Pyrinomonadaceae bacterium]